MTDLFTTTNAVCQSLMANAATTSHALRLVPVYTMPLAEEDVLWSSTLVFPSTDLKLSLAELGRAVDATPLYRHALELEVDKALFRLSMLDELPADLEHKMNVSKGTLRNARKPNLDDGTLCNLFLEHVEGIGLVKLLHILDCDVPPQARGALRGVAELLGRHPDMLAQKLDGWLFEDTQSGSLFSGTFLHRAKRVNTQPEIGIEDSVAQGRAAVLSMHAAESAVHLGAWQALDDVQARICAGLDCVFRYCQFNTLPPFARADIFTLMKLEAMKQVHAERVGDISLLPSAMQPAMGTNQQGLVDPMLEKLVSQMLGYTGSYAGQAGPFLTEAARRAKAMATAE